MAHQVLETLPREQSADVTEYLDPNTAARVLSEMQPAEAAAMISPAWSRPRRRWSSRRWTPTIAWTCWNTSPGRCTTQLLGEMDRRRGRRDAPAGAISARHRRRNHDHARSPRCTNDLTVEQAIDELRRLNEELEQMFYVYVIDRRGIWSACCRCAT